MYKKILILTIGLVFILTSGAMAFEKQKAIKIEGAEPLGPPLATDACTMAKTDGTILSFFSGFSAGDDNVTFFDPALECAATPTYPFEIESITFTLYSFQVGDPPVDAVWPVDVDFVVYDMADPQDFCAGPGVELCRETFTCDQTTFEYPGTGMITFSSPCCVNGPVFVGLEYTGSTLPPYPSILYDTQTATTCDNWFYYSPLSSWYEWYSFWSPPPPGYPIFYVDGETNSPNCEEEPEWPNHKMHFPQLPDEEGWDVYGSFFGDLSDNKVLADDWQCSDSGWVKDIHFWGSWKSDLEGIIDSFAVAIALNIPDNPDYPDDFSMPGTTVWERMISNFTVTPFDPPTEEGWYDPNTGEVLYGDHTHYYRYDIYLDEDDWFHQVQDSIYWLSVVAMVHQVDPPEPQPKWGWKNTRDHFMDDAVYAHWMNLQWAPIIEPPRQNNFNVMFGPEGFPIEWYATNFYGEGWYEYDYWWNIWFYDNPFVYQPKKFSIYFENIPIAGGNPSLEFAINWSTDAWFEQGEPGRPPLPEDENEQLYIGRLIFPVTIGEPFVLQDYMLPIPYNPEWISIDFVGTDVQIVNGVITHECVGTSLDLAFVITGEAEEEVPVYDLWETPEDHNTFVDFGCAPIPADFFGPGSDPFDGIITLKGEPLPNSSPDDLGPTDTIVKRSRAASFPVCPSSDGPIETEIVALNLVSTMPITVTGSIEDPEEWDVRVCLSEVEPQPLGVTNFNRVCQEGGTFTANLSVIPKFIFTRISDGQQVFLDAGAMGLQFPLEITDGHWQFIDSFFDVYVSPPEGVLVSNCDDVLDIMIGPSAVDLIPGLQAIPCVNCVDPATDHIIPITSLIDATGLACAQLDVWPPHDTGEPIPTLSEWGMIILALLLLAAGTIAIVRRRRTAYSRQM